MQKQIYSSPTVQTIEFCTESALLAVSDPTKNPYYNIYSDDEDTEFM